MAVRGIEWPLPRPPDWAITAGLPPPGEDEGFEAYVQRLGLNPAEFTIYLDERTAELANLRLASYLQRRLPDAFRAYVDTRRPKR